MFLYTTTTVIHSLHLNLRVSLCHVYYVQIGQYNTVRVYILILMYTLKADSAVIVDPAV